MAEFDLRARLNKTIRKDLRNNRYEILDLGTKQVTHASPTLKEIVRLANGLGDRIKIECDALCASKRR